MHDGPRQSLKQILARYGETVCDDARRCEALLRDFCGAYRREIFVLISALEQGIADDLRRERAAPPTAQLPTTVVIPRLARELHETTALSEEAARWGVDAWADALGITSGSNTTPHVSVSSPPNAAPRHAPAPSTTRLRLVHTIAAHTGEATDVAFNSDGHQLVSAGLDAAAHIWEVSSGEVVASLRQQTGILTGAAWHPDGLTLALSSADWGVYLWRWLDPGSETPRLRGHKAGVTRVSYAGDGTLVSADRAGLIQLWDPSTATSKAALREHTDAILDIAVSTDGQTLASAGGWDRTVRIWDLAPARERHVLRGHTAQVTSVAFGAGSAAVGSGSWDESARIWDLGTGHELSRFAHHEERVRPLTTLAISADGDLLVTGDWQGSVCLWHIGSQSLIETLTEHQGPVRRVTFSPDGDRLATAGSDGTVCLWRVER